MYMCMCGLADFLAAVILVKEEIGKKLYLFPVFFKDLFYSKGKFPSPINESINLSINPSIDS